MFNSKKVTYVVPIFAILIESLVTIFVFPAREAQARPLGDWYDISWAYRKKITVAYTNVGATLTNFAVLVSVTDTNLIATANGGHVTQSDGGDILFATPYLTKLNHEIEKYVATNGQLIAWVKVDVLSSNVNTDIYIYYGGKNTNKQWNITNTWESSLTLVQHLAETSGTNYDSTSNGNHGTPVGGVSSTTTGKIDGAASFNGADGYVANAGNPSGFAITNGITFAVWVKAQSALQRIMNDNLRVLRLNGNVIGAWVNTAGGDDAITYNTLGSVSVNDGNYHHIVYTWTRGETKNIYYDGINRATAVAITNTATVSGGFLVGARAGGEYFNGTIDEVRIYNRALSAGEILTQYNNQNSPAAFYSIGIEEHAYSITLISVY